MKIQVYNQNAEAVGEMEVSDSIFAVKPSLHLMAESVRAQANNARKGLANTKTRGEVSGGGKKPWKQKGTGRARHGSTRSPIWKGGGVSHGPVKTRDFSQKLNKKMVRGALYSVLSKKLSEGELFFVDAMTSPKGKTKEVAISLKAFLKAKRTIPSTLLIRDSKNASFSRFARNIANVSLLPADSLNIYDVVNAKRVIIEQNAVALIK
jgi:large subunit ribosomal protein L4